MRFIFLFVLILVGLGLFLQTDTDLPHFNWLGHLAGDLVIKKNGTIFYFPITSSLMISILLSVLLGRKK